MATITYVHTNIITEDWKRLADFYVDVFGCRPVPPERDLSGGWLDRATNIRSAHLRGVHLALPGYEGNTPTLEIFQYARNVRSAEQIPNRLGFGHIAFRTDNVLELLAKVVEHGGSQLGELVRTEIKGAGTITFVYARDPDGNIVEIQSWEG
ncbi:MAG TPA: VOC family protein [Puia sp.]|nr:VOC family protein [Puia sp.]